MKPTVSQLLELLNKPALMKWANNIGLQGIKLEDYQKESKSKGSSLHKQIENYFKYKNPFENIEHQKALEYLFKDKKILSIEKNIENKWFRGRLDIEFEMNGNIYVADFKSNSSIYIENKLQLAAYRMGHAEYKTAIIQIPEMIIKEVVFDYSRAELILKCLSKIYQIKNDL